MDFDRFAKFVLNEKSLSFDRFPSFVESLPQKEAYSILLKAVSRDCLPAVECMVDECGLSPEKGDNLLSSAVRASDKMFMFLLKTRSFDRKDLQKAFSVSCSAGRVELVSIGLSMGCSAGESDFASAYAAGHLKIVDMLVDDLGEIPPDWVREASVRIAERGNALAFSHLLAKFDKSLIDAPMSMSGALAFGNVDLSKLIVDACNLEDWLSDIDIVSSWLLDAVPKMPMFDWLLSISEKFRGEEKYEFALEEKMEMLQTVESQNLFGEKGEEVRERLLEERDRSQAVRLMKRSGSGKGRRRGGL